jgi:hypothetical protein
VGRARTGRLEAVHWAADLSVRRLGESFGVMVTYAYDRNEAELDRSARAFRVSPTVARSPAVDALAAAAPLSAVATSSSSSPPPPPAKARL